MFTNKITHYTHLSNFNFWSVKILVYKLRLNVAIDFCLRNVTSRAFQSLIVPHLFLKLINVINGLKLKSYHNIVEKAN
jgi:hypothetical protein